MKIIILAPTIIGGVDYQPSHIPKDVPDHIGQHLLDIGNAQTYEAKVVEVVEKKSAKKTSSAAPQAPASQEPTPKKRRGRPPKSSQ